MITRLLSAFQAPKPFTVEYHEQRAAAEQFVATQRKLVVFRKELASAHRVLGPAFESRWSQFYGLLFIAGPYWGDKSMSNEPDPLARWRRNVDALRGVLGKEHRLEVCESGDPCFDGTWILQGVDSNPWWVPGLYSNVWGTSMRIIVRQYLNGKGCDVTYREVTEQRAVISEECRALATSIR